MSADERLSKWMSEASSGRDAFKWYRPPEMHCMLGAITHFHAERPPSRLCNRGDSKEYNFYKFDSINCSSQCCIMNSFSSMVSQGAGHKFAVTVPKT